jgi:hypothetical protein
MQKICSKHLECDAVVQRDNEVGSLYACTKLHGIRFEMICDLNVHCHENIKSQNIVFF